ncbi:SAM-dependent methyltransferase [Kitasatospora sp. MAP12-15]|uniref:class I SAM-dependent methyltransferase n=1 Tax=unclassified Kitasatospora TaxID=2633591 RepID=UPI0024735A7D|nr:class I SAM-dependent methyltransferase [Kitasatospora sp. MAP12-44]MDH6113731.1 SAM-dependent methyltransferase [Kitasatospora sp. MAP12-44]
MSLAPPEHSAPTTAPQYWDKYRPQRTQRPCATRFDWTGLDDGAPGAEILGEPKTALDLGPAEGENAAFLARNGIEVTAVDFSAVQVERARGFWADLPTLEFIHADALDFLDQDGRLFDAIYSTWGAVWFTDPDELFPRIAKRLAPEGVFAFSHREPSPDQYGAQQMAGTWLEGREDELIVLRWQHTPEQWGDLLKRHGFTDVRTRVIPSPERGALGTLLITARTAA